MTDNKRAARIFGWIEHACIAIALLAVVLFVHTQAYNDEVAMERENAERQARLMHCRCKPEIHGRELIASICQAPSYLGPWFHECLYQGDTK